MSLVEAQAPGQGTDGQFDEEESCAKEQLVFSFPLAGLSKAISLGRQAVRKSSLPVWIHVVAQLFENRQRLGTSDSIPCGVMRDQTRPEIAGTGSGADLQNILMNERHQNKPMDHLHCPLGSLREEAQRTAAIGLRIAMDNLRLRWSERGQMAYEEAKKTADEALTRVERAHP